MSEERKKGKKEGENNEETNEYKKSQRRDAYMDRCILKWMNE